jgi:hypothetical protein
LDYEKQFSFKVAMATLSMYYISLSTYYFHVTKKILLTIQTGYQKHLIGILDEFSPLSQGEKKKKIEKFSIQKIIEKVKTIKF